MYGVFYTHSHKETLYHIPICLSQYHYKYFSETPRSMWFCDTTMCVYDNI